MSVVALIAALLLALGPRSCNGLTDNVLCMPLPRGWSHAVGFGHAPGGTAAWMYAGNFRFKRFGPHDEGTPTVPKGRVLITIGDFPRIHNTWHWRRVDRLRLPKHKRSWRVIFRSRSLFLSVHFGSKPDAHTRALVNRRLRTLRRVG